MKIIIFSLLFSFLVLGCEPQDKAVVSSDPIIIATGIPLGEIGPYVYVGLAANLSDLVYQSLFYHQPNGEIFYVLARKLEWNTNKTRLKVFLKKPWAHNVVQSVNQLMKIRLKDQQKRELGPFLQGLENLKSVQALAPDLIEFELIRFDRTFLYVLPAIRVINPEESDGSSGPFRLVKQGENEIILERKNASPTKVNQIIARRIDSPRRALRELVAGNVDVVALVNPVDFEVLENLEEFDLGLINIEVLYLLLENQSHHKSMAWKKANQLFPRQEFLKLHGYKNLKPGKTSIPENQKDKYGIEEGVFIKDSSADFKQSSRPRQLSFRATNTVDTVLAKYIQRTLQNWGMNIVLRPLTPPEYYQEIYQERSFDLTLMMIKMSQVLTTHYAYFHSDGIKKGQNYVGYSNPLLDKLLDKARYSLDDDEAEENFRLAMKYLLEDPPGIFLYWLQIPLLYRKDCSGFDPNSYLFFLTLENARCEPSVEN